MKLKKRKQRPINRNDGQTKFIITRFYLIFILFLFTISIFSLPFFQNKVFHLSSIEKITQSEEITNILLTAMSTEMPELEASTDIGIEIPSLSTLAFEITTGIKPNELSSILEKSLPGFETYTSEVYVAGEGTNDSNLPVESPPPDFDELLEDEDSSKEESEENKNDQSQNASVFVYHSHSWEAFRPLMDEENVKPSDSSSVDPKENILLVGSMLTKELEQNGIPTIHDNTNVAKSLNSKGWGYSDSYKLTRELIQTATSNQEQLQYYIDVHRDSAGKDVTTKTIDGKKYAKLYFIVGKEHSQYKQNLKFAEQLHTKLEEKYPGISRGVFQKDKYDGNGVYNQDVSENAILIEMGGIDNQKQELQNTIKAFVNVFKEHYDGSIEVQAKPNE
ncbi:stage II sporulation protein P [Salinibacillus kushneri]|uniref:Stage II sporulation protein P n=1 Tax=Salinibacillus kushneri TaxID=237682 RepID=A0A1I0DIH1_9BACI|nr:stage II sporulation protein P [Salinibacillus kushneri]SET31582.1 stage II sporulation protein P [Salinibacillus kushneri]